MIRVNQIRISIHQKDKEKKLRKKAAELLRIKESEIRSFQIVKQSIDGRKKPDIFYSYVVDLEIAGEENVCKRIKNPQINVISPVRYRFPVNKIEVKISEMLRPVIIGSGPAGLFCGLYLARTGFRPIILERGQDVDTRKADVEEFWKTGNLNPESNVQFGEGGAGTFSDGKLNTLVKDKSGRNLEVLKTFVEFGAGESIVYEAKPHIGTDVLCGIIKQMREEIIRLGGEVRFGSKVTRIELQNGEVKNLVINQERNLSCKRVVLAIGHSARDTFEMLYDLQVPMEAKAFAVGLRVEHAQEMINETQYGFKEPGELGAASYKVATQTSTGKGVYSFCMCPGGYVVNASSEEGRLAVNGMSYSGRDGSNANSAVIVSVTPEDFGTDHPLGGIYFQRLLEERAYQAGDGKIPVQRYGDFKDRVLKTGENGAPVVSPDVASKTVDTKLKPMNKGDFRYADLTPILPAVCNQAFVEGMTRFGQMIPGYDSEDTILSGVESRTSSPVRILREEDLQSKIRGIFPCGEGAGYAGGITSAAMDGIRVAEAIASMISKEIKRN